MAGLVVDSPGLVAAREVARGVPWDEVVETVHRQMRSLAGPTADLEDLTQAALEQVVKGLERYEGRAALATYTYRICVNVALNHWRWWRRWLRRFERPRAPDEETPEPPDGATGAADRLLEAERSRRLHAALERIEPTRRLVLTLSDLEELPASRIAEILECPEPTVRSRLRKARQELYQALRRDRLFAQEPR